MLRGSLANLRKLKRVSTVVCLEREYPIGQDMRVGCVETLILHARNREEAHGTRSAPETVQTGKPDY